ncbi:MAG: DNA cytosine methyltransferase [Candidatus Poribacteria bacterium]|nr:DNA cytosine methyltransferase [Candidatus Poribacteria bacterium]
MSSTLNYLDLFAGAGGLSEGFIRAGFKPIAHVEMDRTACHTLRTRMAYHHLKKESNLKQYTDYLKGNTKRKEFYGSIPSDVTKSVINAEISEKTLSDIFHEIDSLLKRRKVNLIIGGPPCQAYSVIGRARCPNRMKDDPRNDLYLLYAEFLKEYKPEYFVFENVPGLLSATDEKGDSYLNLMQNLFREYGYETEFETLNAKDYGVPQNRRRVILVGKKGTSTDFYPELNKCTSDIPVKKILSDLPFITAGGGTAGPSSIDSKAEQWLYNVGIRNDEMPVTLHQARCNRKEDLEIYRIAVDLWNKKKVRLQYNELPEQLQTHQNKSTFLNRFNVVAGSLPYSHTIVAHIAMDGHYYIHYDIEQNRSLTPREAARLQTFPDDYYFESYNGGPRRTPAYRQIGNAVPVLLAQKIAEKLKENWES